ncbi:MAG TPA: SDR family NAD(P)-dependent oxidoreductase [Solirubrobacteraceae bacterium]|jgi:NAD(P)-dependent dehydrogenase (short-subunit alcohol dehydrogenase family)|nr:SDR family NAD(P)-dependent oxidoreductase [Solirubrobacteraceae bacterium]
MSEFEGKVAVVTGAGSGIGRALATELASRGARLAVSDIDADGLAQTAAILGGAGDDVHQQVLDVGDREAVERYAAGVVGHFGVVHQLYNNAGIAHSRTLLESDYADYERVLGVNLWGVIHGTKAFVGHLIASGDGHLVNVSSLNGYLAQEGMTHYCTSKFAVRGFTESVRAEMLSAGLPVVVSCVHPGGIKTNIATAALQRAADLGLPVTAADERRQRIYNERLLRMDPAKAARIIVDGVEAGRPRILVGKDAKLVDLLVRLAPAQAVRLSVAGTRLLTR